MEKLRTPLRWLFAFFLAGVGVQHFTDPQIFIDIMPPYLQAWDLELVYISGVFEILGGIGLLVPQTRKIAGVGIILLLLAVFPANIHMAINDVPFQGERLPPMVRWGRLPFQLVFIAIAWWTSRPAPIPEGSSEKASEVEE